MSIEAMKQALAQLNRDDVYLGHRSKTRADAITALRQAIEQAESLDKLVAENQKLGLYDSPKREWVGLTHEERDEIDQNCRSQMEALFAVEAKLKEKNCPSAD